MSPPAALRDHDRRLDCLVIGGGPAGLTAAIYLRRFRRSVLVVDKGWSRAKWITLSHNLPGFPDGVAGPALLEKMRDQARRYGAVLEHGTIETLRDDATGLFIAEMSGKSLIAHTVVLAAGVVENSPPLPHVADTVKSGLVRTCPICDGYEAIGKTIAVLGNGEHAAAEALFLRTFSSRARHGSPCCCPPAMRRSRRIRAPRCWRRASISPAWPLDRS